MTDNGNRSHHGNGDYRWWQIWKRGREQDLDPDFSAYRRLALQLNHGLPREVSARRSALIVTPAESLLWAAACVTLASCMAEELRRPVLLVDASGDGELSRMLESPFAAGLTDLLANPTRPLDELALPTSQPGVWFLAKGTSEGVHFFASPEDADDLLARLSEAWDFVIVAGGPVLRSSFPLAMAPYVGRVLLLVIENSTRIEDIDAAQNALTQCRAQDVSLVVTQSVESMR